MAERKQNLGTDPRSADPEACDNPMEESAQEVSELLKLLANKNRLMILCALIKQPMTVGQIEEYVGCISQSALSQYLARMRSAGLLRAEKNGLFVQYSIADTRILSVMEVLEENYCKQ